MKYTIGIRLTDEQEAMGTDLAQHGVTLPYVPYVYKEHIDELIQDHDVIKKEKRRLLQSEDIFERDDNEFWKDSFSAMDEELISKVHTLWRHLLYRVIMISYYVWLKRASREMT